MDGIFAADLSEIYMHHREKENEIEKFRNDFFPDASMSSGLSS